MQMIVTVWGTRVSMRLCRIRVLILGIRGPVCLEGKGEGKQKKGKTKEDYESNMSDLALALVSRLDKGVSFEKSGQSGPREELLCQAVNIISKLPDLSEQQIVNAFEFFWVNLNAQPLFLRMQESFRSS